MPAGQSRKRGSFINHYYSRNPAVRKGQIADGGVIFWTYSSGVSAASAFNVSTAVSCTAISTVLVPPPLLLQ